jgi:hypothetical protein
MPSREPGFLVGVSDVATTPCTAVLAGATGLVGRELLSLLLAGVHYRSGLLNFTHGQGSAAQASIVSSFAVHAVGANAKATQTSGMKACRETEAGIKGVKELSLSAPVLGGRSWIPRSRRGRMPRAARPVATRRRPFARA